MPCTCLRQAGAGQKQRLQNLGENKVNKSIRQKDRL